ncbi:MAG TPA: 3-dehydroquinate synthase [Gemmataceae bacterium]|jgi:3-dehydroquinate synthase|nr:3-dehydroquinate synthase [Gemmataceae bacterium]
MQTLRVNLGPRSYEIAIGTGSGDHFAEFVRERLPGAARSVVVTDSNTRSHGERLARSIGTDAVTAVAAGEASKSLACVTSLYSELAARSADRKTPLIAVGGGVIGDLTGFVAATYNRGLPLVMVPTTLLAMVDSSVGGKVGVNLPEGKNLVGAFHQPACVWIDTALLDTLPDREYRSGLAEVVKYGVILDPVLFEWLEANTEAIVRREPRAIAHMVARSCRLKADVVEQDEREEAGLRLVLNYGHTFAHAYETLGGYGSWLHGEAVAAGMVSALRLAERRGLVTREVIDRQMALLKQFGLPTERRPEWEADSLIAVMRRDKKNVGGRMRFILPTRLGHVAAFDDVPESELREVLASP